MVLAGCIGAEKRWHQSFYVDYRKINSVTRKDAYPLPRINDVLDTLARVRKPKNQVSGIFSLTIEMCW